MNYDSATRWLCAWRAKSILTAVLGAVGGFALSAVLLAPAWLLILMVSLRVVGDRLSSSAGWAHPLIATAVLLLLFIGNARVSRETLGEYSFTTGTATDKVVTIPGYGSNVNPLALSSVMTAAKIVGDVLFCGPRVTVWSFRQAERALLLLPLDVPGCAAVLTVLHGAGRRLP